MQRLFLMTTNFEVVDLGMIKDENEELDNKIMSELRTRSTSALAVMDEEELRKVKEAINAL